MISPNDCLNLYTAIKLHFNNEGYDFFKYQGQLKFPPKLSKRKDKHFFEWLSKKDDPAGLIIANVADDPQVWIGNLLHEKAKETYLAWRKRQDTTAYTFQTEFRKLAYNFPDAFTCIAGSHPLALKLYLQREVSVDTLVITNQVMAFLPNWDKVLVNDALWKTMRLSLIKYRGFVEFNEAEYRKIILNILREANTNKQLTNQPK